MVIQAVNCNLQVIHVERMAFFWWIQVSSICDEIVDYREQCQRDTSDDDEVELVGSDKSVCTGLVTGI